MNPFGILNAVVGALEILGGAFGRKRRKETRGKKVVFGVLYAGLMLLCIVGVILVIRELYFTP
jgi:hypothetical protein